MSVTNGKNRPKHENPAHTKALGGSKSSPEVWSFFSGAMGLDLGLEMAGIHPTLAVEIDPWCCKTIRSKRPSLTLFEGDVTKLSGADLREFRGFLAMSS